MPKYCEDADCPGTGLEIADDSHIQILDALPVTYDPSIHSPLFYDCALNAGQGGYFTYRIGAGGPTVLYMANHWDVEDLTQRNNIANNAVILTAPAQSVTNPSALQAVEGIIVVDATAVFDGDDGSANAKLQVQYQVDSGGWSTAYTGYHAKDPLGTTTAPGYEHHAHFSMYAPSLAAGVTQSWEWRLRATSVAGNVDEYAARLVAHLYGAVA